MPTIHTLRAAAGFLVLIATTCPAHADVTFSDTEFTPANWGFESVVLGPGGTSTPSQVAGGNPGQARQVVNSINAGGGASVFGLSRYGTTTPTRYEPATQGAITSIDWSIDSKWLSGFGGQGQSISLGAKQGLVVYYADYDITGSSGAWTTHGAVNLLASSFQPLTAGAPIDFSATGAPIRFGFLVGNSGDFAYTNTVVYDNFSITIHNVPAPAIAGLAMFTLPIALRHRRHR